LNNNKNTHPQRDIEKNGEPVNRLLTTAVLCVVILFFGLRLWCSGKMELLPQEAYYWTYAQHPALSYYDHPPLAAWTIQLGTALFGDIEIGVRIATIILSMGGSILMFLIGRIWFGRHTALWAFLLFNLLPIYVGTGWLAFPDGPLIFFWLLTLYFLSKAILTRYTAYWVLAGASFGFALLSKYTALLLAPSLLIFLLAAPSHRYWIFRAQPWIALLTGLLVFSPVIIWNAKYDWVSFLFQTTRTAGQTPQMIKYVSEFWLFQLGILTPAIFILLAAATWHAIKRGWFNRQDQWNFAVSFFLPLFLVFFLASFKTKVHINWTAPAYLSMLPASVAFFREGIFNQSNLLYARCWRVAGALSLSLCVVIIVLALSSLTWGVPRKLSATQAGGWRQLATLVKEAKTELASQTGQEPFILGIDKFYLASELGFYTQRPKETVNWFAVGYPGLGYHYWTDLKALDGRPAIAVLPDLRLLSSQKLQTYFNQIGDPRYLKILNIGKRERNVYLVDCYGYRAPKSGAMNHLKNTKMENP
jgi:dolichol-phosphate mannosyltransferase